VPEFVPGLELARGFYEEVVSPLVGDRRHSAARLGSGSDVLGFDTERSTDHGWGPRVNVFVAAHDVENLRETIDAGLPDEFRGWPTRFGWDDVPVTQHVEVAALGAWLEERIGFDACEAIEPVQWLCAPQQRLLEVVSGAVFHDPDGELAAVRAALAWYPDDVWLWLLACQWRRLDQEEAFVGRAAEVGDELGSRVVASRLVRDLMRLAFLLERRYAPYSKWLGSAFARLDAAASLEPPLLDVLAARDREARESGLVASFEELAARHNALGITDHVEPTIRPFHSRPYRVLASGRFVDACLARVRDPRLRSLPLVGGVDQVTDSSDALEDPCVFAGFGFAAFYGR
jgi:Domain of unknown function (DUF4037)